MRMSPKFESPCILQSVPDPPHEPMLFSGLWSWLRALSLGLLSLLRGLTAIVGHPGVAIIALAICVKILLLPLAAVGDRLQEQVNAAQARLQPGIDAIKTAHRELPVIPRWPHSGP